MNQKTTTIALSLAVLFAIIIVELSYALPSGATISGASNIGLPNRTAGNRSDPRGTITTLVLDALQQDQYWKAYVGNVTGRLSLDNPAGYTIYEWSLAGINKSGEIYVTRVGALDFENISCASEAALVAEHSFYNMTNYQTDSVNRTFNATTHSAFYTGMTQFAANACTKTTATYVNDSAQVMDGTQRFQELVLVDSANSLIYMTMISTYVGYDNRTYDFQIIVPESGIRTTPTTYYFFTELG